MIMYSETSHFTSGQVPTGTVGKADCSDKTAMLTYIFHTTDKNLTTNCFIQRSRKQFYSKTMNLQGINRKWLIHFILVDYRFIHTAYRI